MKQTKSSVIDEIFQTVEDFRSDTDTLFALFENGKIGHGEYTLHVLHYNFHYRILFGTKENPSLLHGSAKKRTTLADFNYHLSGLKTCQAQLKHFLESKVTK